MDWSIVVAIASLGAITWQGRRLQNLVRDRDRHLAHVAHELRTPLASVSTALELLRASPAGGPEADEFLTEAEFAAHHLGGLVDDVLDAAALQDGRLHVTDEPLPAAATVDQCLSLLGRLAQQRGLRLIGSCEPGLCVRGDSRRVRQILLNLVGNAVKYCDRGGTVQLAAREVGDTVHFVVADDGPGVPPALQPRLFEAFAHGDHAHTRSSGLGLFVSARLAEAMHGRLGFAPRSPRGATFWLELPRLTAADRGIVAPAPTAAR
ncbi:MAG: HAMP domain-containing histidine kinase [Planctomycetes bacterium]|nr:HAMP domain-containing histidine kinase [Planctomycetota bacterium]